MTQSNNTILEWMDDTAASRLMLATSTLVAMEELTKMMIEYTNNIFNIQLEFFFKTMKC